VNGRTEISQLDLAARCIQLMSGGSFEAFAAVIHPDAVNRESGSEPPATRERGPSALRATSQWLLSAFDGLTWEIHAAVSDGDTVAVHTTMHGSHVRPFVLYGPDGSPVQAFPPTGRTFAVAQTHWFRILEGQVIEHWAVRDDLGQAQQLGWIPPKPAYLLGMRRALRRARRMQRQDEGAKVAT